MTQEIQYTTSSYAAAPASRTTLPSTTQPVATERSDGWVVKILRSLFRFVVSRRLEPVPDSLIDDLGLRSHSPAAELRSEFNALDSQLHARFY